MIKKFRAYEPEVHKDAYVAETAVVIGRTKIAVDANIWFGTVIRADVNAITIGARTNIQDNTIIHVADDYETVIGEDVTVGHGAIIHGSIIGNNVLIGMGAIILDGAKIGDDVIIGAGALIPPGKVIPSGSLVVGSPGKVVRDLSQDEIESLSKSANKYVGISKEYVL